MLVLCLFANMMMILLHTLCKGLSRVPLLVQAHASIAKFFVSFVPYMRCSHRNGCPKEHCDMTLGP